MIRGEIFYGRKNSDAIHPIVFLKNYDEDFFVGAMLTHSSLFKDNILMKTEYFKTISENGLVHKLRCNNTHLVKAKLLKRNDWHPFIKIGELTEEGIEFVERNVNSELEKLWEDYLSGN